MELKKTLSWALLWYFRLWARIALFLHRPTIIGITGSVGKSSTREAIFAVLSDHKKTIEIQKGNSETGIPLGILGYSVTDYSFFDWVRLFVKAPFGLSYLSGYNYLIVEMGVDEPESPKNMEYLLTILKPHIAVVLNASAAHTAQFAKVLPTGTSTEDVVKKIAEEKMKIITHNPNCRIGIINGDDTAIGEETRNKKQETKLAVFGSKEENDIVYKNWEVSLDHTVFEFKAAGKTIKIELQGFLLPEVYREVLAASILVGFECGLSISQIQSSLMQNFRLPPSRGSVFKGIHNSTIIDSSYNASRKSVSSFLDLLFLLKKKYKKPAVFVFGDMRELGESAQAEHVEIARKISTGADYLYCVGPLTKKYVIESLRVPRSTFHDIKWFESSIKAGEYLKEHLPKNAIVLVKGSQNTIFLEETVKYLLQNTGDIKKICRQSDYWRKVKKDL